MIIRNLLLTTGSVLNSDFAEWVCAWGHDGSIFARPQMRLESRLQIDPALQIGIDRLTRLLRPTAAPQIRNQD
ncbi:MAG TPA: hypothetical protein VMR54_11680 [Thermoanaerobaculia bacterium]|nr:hypothetical protein [Thermoanaerobaculia bacterium]HTR76535.1 hypothetical protein [Gemmatimonadaceae bacterium]